MTLQAEITGRTFLRECWDWKFNHKVLRLTVGFALSLADVATKEYMDAGVPLPNAQPAQLAPPQQETIDLLIQRVDRILPPPHQNAAIKLGFRSRVWQLFFNRFAASIQGGIILLCRSIRPDD
ncbi:hypothetical protein FPQ18DRAFT_377010 [Pyronema domesticum]|nr:hypothetical protein FPQ18DRAFT_377010 [Pyronema domesticum]